jgi:hypothetical protein
MYSIRFPMPSFYSSLEIRCPSFLGISYILNLLFNFGFQSLSFPTFYGC